MSSLASQIEFVPLESLRLDPRNPRLTEAEQAGGTTPIEQLKLMDREYDPLTIAESIAEHGYFASEPMIVLDEGHDELTVLEAELPGCSRAYTNPCNVSAQFRDPRRWAQLRERANVPNQVPVIRAAATRGRRCDRVSPHLWHRALETPSEGPLHCQPRRRGGAAELRLMSTSRLAAAQHRRCARPNCA